MANPATDITTVLQQYHQRVVNHATGRRYSPSEDPTSPPTTDEIPTLNDIIEASDPILNGGFIAPTQAVSVVYLSQEQRLVIPYGMGALGTVLSDATFKQQLNVAKAIEKLWKTGTTEEYLADDLGSFRASPAPRASGSQSGPDAAPAEGSTETLARYVHADGMRNWTVDGDITFSTPRAATLSITIAAYCLAIKVNMDPRDFDFFLGADNRCDDSDWRRQVAWERIKPKLHTFSVQSLASLNKKACKEDMICALARALCVSAGMFPAADSKHGAEFAITKHFPTAAGLRMAKATMMELGTKLHIVAYSIMSMFGLLHLARHHTYRQGDAVMERVGKAYINALRTVISPERVAAYINTSEIILRTAMHPFGLAQCLAMAVWSHNSGHLAEPLAIRVLTNPPEVSRLMFLHAGLCSMKAAGYGALLQLMDSRTMAAIEEEVRNVKADSPAYSALHRHYGVDERRCVSQNTADGMNDCQIIVAAYVQAYYAPKRAGESAHGLALAASLGAIVRDNGAVIETYRLLIDAHKESLTSGDPAQALAKLASLRSAGSH